MKRSHALWVALELAVVLTPAAAGAAEYYVDNTAANASDAGPGSEAEPWANAPGMPGWTGTATLAAGDVVYFASHGTWTSADGFHLLDVTPGVTFDGAAWSAPERVRDCADTGEFITDISWIVVP